RTQDPGPGPARPGPGLGCARLPSSLVLQAPSGQDTNPLSLARSLSLPPPRALSPARPRGIRVEVLPCWRRLTMLTPAGGSSSGSSPSARADRPGAGARLDSSSRGPRDRE
ncbi:ATP-dependent DNA helicase II subunit 2, partial [Frankliniella fusca]